jgi:LemA protein
MRLSPGQLPVEEGVLRMRGLIFSGFVALAAGLIVALVFNRLVRYRMRMREALSGVEVQLKRRHDLIPNIVEAVKGHMEYESKVFEQIASIRSEIANAATVREKNVVENTVTAAFKTLFALTENYPDLKAHKSFLGLQEKLSEVEDQIQMARRYYNGTVRDYNIAVESFPGNIVAAACGFRPADFFEIEYATQRRVPDVHFSASPEGGT